MCLCGSLHNLAVTAHSRIPVKDMLYEPGVQVQAAVLMGCRCVDVMNEVGWCDESALMG